MNAEFNWWLLIVGLAIGAGLVWLILADGSRREADVTTRERASEARWIAEELRRAGRRVDDDDVADVLDLHAAYLAAPPPDEPDEEVAGVPGRADVDWSRAERGAPGVAWSTRTTTDATTDATATPTATPTEPTRDDAPPPGMTTSGPTSPGAVPIDPSGVDWAARRSAADRPRSDGRDQPSPSRTG